MYIHMFNMKFPFNKIKNNTLKRRKRKNGDPNKNRENKGHNHNRTFLVGASNVFLLNSDLMFITITRRQI